MVAVAATAVVALGTFGYSQTTTTTILMITESGSAVSRSRSKLVIIPSKVYKTTHGRTLVESDRLGWQANRDPVR